MAFFLGAMTAEALGLEVGSALAGVGSELLAWLPVAANTKFDKKAYTDLKDHPVDTLVDAGEVLGVSMFRGAFDPIGSAVDTVKGTDTYIEHNRNYTVGEAAVAVAVDAAFGGVGTQTLASGMKSTVLLGDRAVAEVAEQEVAGDVVKTTAPSTEIPPNRADPRFYEERLQPEPAEAPRADPRIYEERARLDPLGTDVETTRISRPSGSDGSGVPDSHHMVRQAAADAYLSPETRTDIGDHVYDAELSTPETAVYHNHTTEQTVVAHRGSTDLQQDWLASNPSILTGSQHSDPRFVRSMDLVEEAHNRHNYDVVTTGHSLGGSITMSSAYKYAAAPWMQEAVAFNPQLIATNHPFQDPQLTAAADKITTVHSVVGDPASAQSPAFGNLIRHDVPFQPMVSKHNMSSFYKEGRTSNTYTDFVAKNVTQTAANKVVEQFHTPTVGMLLGLSKLSELQEQKRIEPATNNQVVHLDSDADGVDVYGIGSGSASGFKDMYVNIRPSATSMPGMTPASYKNTVHRAQQKTEQTMKSHPSSRIHLGGMGLGGHVAAHVMQNLGHLNQVVSGVALNPGRAALSGIAAMTHLDRTGILNKLITVSPQAHAEHGAAAAQGTHLVFGPSGLREVVNTARQQIRQSAMPELLQETLREHNQLNPVSTKPIGTYTEPPPPQQYEHEPDPELKEDVLQAVLENLPESHIMRLPAEDMYEILSL